MNTHAILQCRSTSILLIVGAVVLYAAQRKYMRRQDERLRSELIGTWDSEANDMRFVFEAGGAFDWLMAMSASPGLRHWWVSNGALYLSGAPRPKDSSGKPVLEDRIKRRVSMSVR